MSNLWILTEERPKLKVLKQIINKVSSDLRVSVETNELKIIPKLNEKNQFTFTYYLEGVNSKKFKNIYLKIVTGSSSFVDYLIFIQNNEPTFSDTPLYAIEETKTDDKESRNTGVHQRLTKFVYIDYYYKNIKKIMLYNLVEEEKETQTDSNNYGTKILNTLGVEILGKKNIKDYSKFNSIDDVINLKNSMKMPPKGNVPKRIYKASENKLEVSGRLFKSGSLSHDPSIGELSGTTAVLRKLGFKGKIVITKHGIKQKHLMPNNKFVKIASALDLDFEGLNSVKGIPDKDYWKYEENGEKNASILLHILIENFTKGRVIFENHAGGEKGYFYDKGNNHHQLPKYRDKEKYKQGDKTQIIQIPDLILHDEINKEIINMEGKKTVNQQKGLDEMKLFDGIENALINTNYPKHTVIRSLILFGEKKDNIHEDVGFWLDNLGNINLQSKTPRIIKDSFENLINYV